MIPELYEGLISKLKSKTESGEVNWKTTTSSYVYVADFQEFSLAVKYLSSQDEPDVIEFTLLDSGGEEIDNFYVDESEPESWSLALDVYSRARRQARKIDEAIKHISKELDKPSSLI